MDVKAVLDSLKDNKDFHKILSSLSDIQLHEKENASQKRKIPQKTIAKNSRYQGNDSDSGGSAQNSYTPAYNPSLNSSANYPSNGHPEPYNNSTCFLREIKVMVTMIHDFDVTEFWGQLFTKRTLDFNSKLEKMLREVCPGLKPCKTVERYRIYAAKWDDVWYRCITTSRPVDHFLAIFFVDFGNRAKRKVDQLRLLPSNFMEIPFLAFPFRMPGLEQVPEAEMEAIRQICTSQPISLFVASAIRHEQQTPAILMRLGSELERELPEVLTYNSFLLYKGLVKVSDTQRPSVIPTAFFITGLERNLKRTTLELQNVSAELARLKNLKTPNYRFANGEEPRNVSSTSSPFHKSTKTEERDMFHIDRSRNNHDHAPSNHDHAPSNHDHAPSNHDHAPKYCTHLSPHPTPSPDTDDLINTTLSHLQRYYINSSFTNSQLTKLQETLESLEVMALPGELIGQERILEDVWRTYDEEQDTILSCEGKECLEELVRRRDEVVSEMKIEAKSYIDLYRTLNISDNLAILQAIQQQHSQHQISPKTDNKPIPKNHHSSLTDDSRQSDLASVCEHDIQNFKLALNSMSSFVDQLQTTPNSSIPEFSLLPHLRKLQDSLQTYNSFVSEEAENMEPLIESMTSVILTKCDELLLEITHHNYINTIYTKRLRDIEKYEVSKPDFTPISSVRQDIKVLKRELKLALVDLECLSDEEGDIPATHPDIHCTMQALHKLYDHEDSELTSILYTAHTYLPELFTVHPALRSELGKHRLVKRGWELSQFVLPNSQTYLNENYQCVSEGVFGEEKAFFVEFFLKNVDTTPEADALRQIEHSLPGCFAILVDGKHRRAYGATKTKP